MRTLTPIMLAAAVAFAAIACGRSGLLEDGQGFAIDGPGGSSLGGSGKDGGGDGATEDGGLDALDPAADPPTVHIGEKVVPNVQQIVAGESHACLRDKKSRVFCWGGNGEGDLGTGSTDDFVPTAVRVNGLPDIVRLASGMHHTCALGVDQSVWCWGSDKDGELGNGKRQAFFSTPQQVVTQKLPVAITAGGWHTCATDADGELSCWGRNTAGECGRLGADRFLVPTPVPTMGKGVGAITAGTWHTCGVLPDGTVRCFGRNEDGQLGMGDTGAFETLPQVVLNVAGATYLMAGDDHTCALTTSDRMWCWGDGFLGELGNGRGQGGGGVPTPVVHAAEVVHASGGLEHTCAALRSGRAQCWGKGLQGQLGNGDTALMSAVPVEVRGIVDAVQVATGSQFSCIAHAGRGAACWGASLGGQLGHGLKDDEFQTTAVEVQGL